LKDYDSGSIFSGLAAPNTVQTNPKQRRIVILADIDKSIKKVLIFAGNCFYYIFNQKYSEDERQLLKWFIGNQWL
jgi:hypothetical protein